MWHVCHICQCAGAAAAANAAAAYRSIPCKKAGNQQTPGLICLQQGVQKQTNGCNQTRILTQASSACCCSNPCAESCRTLKSLRVRLRCRGACTLKAPSKRQIVTPFTNQKFCITTGRMLLQCVLFFWCFWASADSTSCKLLHSALTASGICCCTALSHNNPNTAEESLGS
jgi:hypothetical protein